MNEQPGPWKPGWFAWAGLALAAFLLWVPPLRSGLTIDESVTYCIVKDDLATTLRRSWQDTPAPLYFVAVHLAVGLFGNDEAVIRAPSVIAMALATLLVYALGRRLRDAETGFLSATVFVATPELALAAADARPYAFEILTLLAATWVLVSWVERPRVGSGLLYGALVAAAIYGHYLLATALLAHPVYALAKWRRHRFPGARTCLVPIAAAFVLVLPLVPHAMTLARMNPQQVVWPKPHWPDLMGSLVPDTAAALAIGVVLALPLGWPRSIDRGSLTGNGPILVFLAAWHVAPRLLIYLVSCLTTMRMFVGRYLLGAAPGWALLVGFLLRAVDPPAGRRLLPVVLLSYAVVTETTPHHTLPTGPFDWRPVVAELNRLESEGATPAPILAATGLPFPDYPYALAPFSRYPVRGVDVTPLPSRLDDATLPYLQRALDDAAASGRVFVVVPATEGARAGMCVWTTDHLAGRGFTRPVMEAIGGCLIMGYEQPKRTDHAPQGSAPR